jgi:PAS domain S-box-containing protein
MPIDSRMNKSLQLPGKAAANSRPRWHLLYFVLAAFDLLTIGVSLSLNHRLMKAHTESLRVNQEWSERRNRLSELGQLAAAVNAPGNDVFDSRDVPAESARMRAALVQFDTALAARRRDLVDNVRDENGPKLLVYLDGVGTAMSNMVEEAHLIFTYFEGNQAAKAGERMATMDRKFAQLNVRLGEVRTAIQDIQNLNFSRQNTVIASLRRYEYVIATSILVMVFGIAFYGHKLSESVTRTLRENEQHLAAIRASEQRYRLLFESNPIPAWVCDRQTLNFLAVNEAAVRNYGYSREEFMRMTLRDIHPVKSIPTLFECVAAESPAPTPPIAWRHRRKNGPLISVEISIYSFDFEGKAASLILANDITERTKAESALLESEARAQRAHAEAEALLSTISAVFVGVDTEGKIRRWNSAAEVAFGIPATLALGQHIRVCGIPWNWPSVESVIVDSLGTRKSIEMNDVPYVRFDHKDGFLHLVITPVPGDSTDGLNFTLLGTDITQRRLLENQLRQAQKLESIGQLAAGIAHEINTPTQFVGDNLRFLQDSFGNLGKAVDLLPHLLECASRSNADSELLAQAATAIADADLDYLKAEIPKAIEQSLDGTTRVAKIVQAMKDFSHPDAGDKKPTDLNKAIEATATVARSEWKYVAELKVELDPALPLVPCLAGEVNQVILNLLVNAAHAIADTSAVTQGGKGTIGVRTKGDADWVEIRVSDTGTGIPEHARAKIFDPFFTTKPVGKGTGQGLFIAHNVVVEKHGGTITFETESGRGTTFIVRLPINPATAQEERRAA